LIVRFKPKDQIKQIVIVDRTAAVGFTGFSRYWGALNANTSGTEEANRVFISELDYLITTCGAVKGICAT